MPDPGDYLLWLARARIARQLALPQPPEPHRSAETAAALAQPAATFVTLTQGGALRGCIGSLEAHRPLQEDIEHNALAAAFRDPRFPPLSADELASVRIEVSRLSTPEPLPFTDEANALQQLRPGIDGLILTAGHRRATFLPQVWAQLPDPAEFLVHLKYKAGLPASYWGKDVQLARYRVEKWQEA